jgi:hypothetical protein
MPSRFFTSALMTSALLALVVAANPAVACKGSEILLRDDFTDEDPAWNIQDTGAQIGGGVLKVKSESGKIYNLMYQGQNFPGADVCIDIIAPSGKPSPDIQGGLGLWTGKAWNFVNIATDGSAGVDGLQDSNWTSPVPKRKFDGIKTTPNTANQLRVTWKAPPPSNSKAAPDPTVTIFINDKQFIKYKVTPNSNRSISIFTTSDGAVYQYKNLVVTSN